MNLSHELTSSAVFDLSAFPLVIARNDAIAPGYAVAWEQDMNALLKTGEHFVLLFISPRPEETHEDRKQRGMWLKTNRDALSQVCKALITVEPDEREREESKAGAAAISKAFGIPLEAVATLDDAKKIGRQLLSETGD
ncbi:MULTISPECIES: hypothetical protein [Paraburkholderia]|uniref:DsDNA-binding SOS-regulon protein n=2 Tax=Paraburkholderia TaxID=1822464 RepID=A0A7Z0B583_9BURK|nr:hypothetical protein [Paraburkholderia bryophila]NYH20167.1 dsDNA-binding SOS-regulon protein [Paraburkholderia bryophila]NYH20808.1 dsDNA-binding SOS-regulon protein [Paraburkholderia bryophila]